MVSYFQKGGQVSRLDRYNKKIRDIRPVAMRNPNGKESTVLMQSIEVDGKYYAIPSLFPKNPKKVTPSPKDWKRLFGMEAFEEASKKGELFEFSTPDSAEAYAEGTWKLQQGGEVMNKYLQQTPQEGSTDTVPAMLTPGEFVIRKDAADEIGRDKLHALNNIDRLSGMAAITNYKPPQFQEGGEVRISPRFIDEQMKKKLFGQYESDRIVGVPAESVGGDGGYRYYLSSGQSPMESLARKISFMDYVSQIASSPQDSLSSNIINEYLNYRETLPEDFDRPVEGNYPKEKKELGRLKKKMWKQVKKERKGMQEGGEVMNYYGGGMVRDARARYQEGGVVEALEAFGEKSKSADDLSVMALIEMFKAQQLPQQGSPMVPNVAWGERPQGAGQPSRGLQQGGPVPPMPQQALPPAGFMQEGGEVSDGEKYGMFMSYDIPNADKILKSLGLTQSTKGHKGYKYPEWSLKEDSRLSQLSTSPENMKTLQELIRLENLNLKEEPERQRITDYLTKGGFSKKDVNFAFGSGGKMMGRPFTDKEFANILLTETGPDRIYGFHGEKYEPMVGMRDLPDMEPETIPRMQEGGEVEQPMPVGEAAGMQEMPIPEGERAYPQEPMDQLGLEDHEYAAYTEHGPDVYKYLAPKYKPKVQWTPYDAMVDAGSINPYEVDKDDFVVITRDMANALRAA